MISDAGTENSINETIQETKGPTEDNNKTESQKAWTMEMLMNGFDNSMTKGDRRVQKHDDGRTGSYPIRIQSTSISSGDYLPNHKYD